MYSEIKQLIYLRNRNIMGHCYFPLRCVQNALHAGNALHAAGDCFKSICKVMCTLMLPSPVIFCLSIVLRMIKC